MLRRIRKEFLDIRPGEWPKAVGLSLYFFLVIAVFWVLKPMKRGILLNYFSDQPINIAGWILTAAQAEQLGKVLNMIIAFGVVALFTWLVRRMARHHLVLVFCAGFGLLFAFFGVFIDRMSLLGQAGIWSFYVMGDIWTTVMVATFWAFANDLNTGDEAERLYGLVGLGGVVGGFVGASIVAELVTGMGRAPLLFGSIVPLIAIGGLVVWLHDCECEPDEEGPCCPEDDTVMENEGSVFLEGARIVAASKYLLGIAAVLGIYEMVSNIVDFQLAAIVTDQITDSTQRDAFFGMVGQATGIVSIVVQLVLTSFVMKRFGVKVALLFLPVAILGGTIGFLAVPTALLAGAMSVSDNALNYSINQSAKEALYTPTSQDAKYKAKSFIDMFVQRAAKVAAVVLNIGLTALVITDVRWLSIAVALLTVVWIGVVRFLGRRFDERKAEGDEMEPAPAA